MRGSLFDASAIINCVWLGKTEKLLGKGTIELARFELGNYAWKRRDLKIEDRLKVFERLLELVEMMELLDFDARKAFLLASEENLTFYDACYLQAAIDNELRLVTDDSKLKKVARKYVEVKVSWEV